MVLSGQEGCSCAGKAFTAHSSLIWGLLTWDTRRELVAFTSHHYLQAQTAAGQPSAFGEGLLLSRCRFWFFTFILLCSRRITSIGSGKHFDKISLLQIKNSLSSLLLRVPVLPHPQRRSAEPNHCLEQLRPLFWCKATRKKKEKKRSPVYPAVTLARV